MEYSKVILYKSHGSLVTDGFMYNIVNCKL